MTSKIEEELVKATEYPWDDNITRAKNIEALCRATVPLSDVVFGELSTDSRKFIDTVITALTGQKDIPEFPDFTPDELKESPAPAPEQAPRRRSRLPPPPPESKETEPASTTIVEDPTTTVDPAPAKAPRSRRKAPPPRGAAQEAAAPAGATESVATEPKRTRSRTVKSPKVDDEGCVRGERMERLRILIITDPSLTKLALLAESKKKGFPCTAATVGFVKYHTEGTLKALQTMGLYNHWEGEGAAAGE